MAKIELMKLEQVEAHGLCLQYTLSTKAEKFVGRQFVALPFEMAGIHGQHFNLTCGMSAQLTNIADEMNASIKIQEVHYKVVYSLEKHEGFLFHLMADPKSVPAKKRIHLHGFRKIK
jgi:hypothetical protein